MQIPEIAKIMLTYARQHGNRAYCCDAQRRVKGSTKGRRICQSQKSILRFLCSRAVEPILAELGVPADGLRLRSLSFGPAHKCPCEKPLCSLPFQSFHGVEIQLLNS